MNKFMIIALEEAQKSLKYGDVPVGAIIVKKNVIISKAHNEKEKTKTATKHAEIIAIEKACKKLKSWHLDECDLYVTLEPCLMCCGAIIQSRIKNIYYSTESKKFGYVESVNCLFNDKNNHIPHVFGGLEKDKSVKLLKDFFRDKRD